MTMDGTISLYELFQTIRKHLILVFSCTFLAVLISGVLSYVFITPIYQASTQLLVNQSNSEQPMYTSNEIQTNLQLINTYNVIIKSPAILNLVRDELALDHLSVEQLNSKIKVESEQNSQVVTVTVQDPDQYIAKDIANTIAMIFQREVIDIMNVNNVSILAEATASELQTPVKPNPLLNMVIAGLVGVTVGVGIAFLIEHLDNTLKTEQDIEKQLGITVIGTIASINAKEIGKISKVAKGKEREEESEWGEKEKNPQKSVNSLL